MNDETPFRILLIFVSVVQTVISLRYLKKAKAGSTIFRRREEGILLSIAIVVFYLAYGVAVVTYFLNPNWMAWSAFVVPSWIRWVGIVPLLFGAFWIIWGLHHIGDNITVSIKTREDHALITTGPYHWVRHPLYAAGIIESVGVCLMMANWFVAISAGLFWTLIALRTPMEEQKLIEKFGDKYCRYMQRVGRFMPRIDRAVNAKNQGKE